MREREWLGYFLNLPLGCLVMSSTCVDTVRIGQSWDHSSCVTRNAVDVYSCDEGVYYQVVSTCDDRPVSCAYTLPALVSTG